MMIYFLDLTQVFMKLLKDNYEDKYEYILPDLTLNKNLVSNNILGNLDLETNFQVRKYDTNKFTNFFINDFNWNYKFLGQKTIFNNKLFSKY